MIVKSIELTASVKLLNEKLHFEGNVEGNIPVSIDYVPPFGDNLGYTSLELLLLSLSSCIGSSVLIFLRKMRKSITGFEIITRGVRKEEHPTGFKKIFVEIKVCSNDVTSGDLIKVIKLSEETYCPVLSMLKGNVEILITHIINPE
jgi:putative redox protein